MPASQPEDSFLKNLRVFGIRGGKKVWGEGEGSKARYYTWDGLHGEVEVYNHRRRHLGVMDPVSRRFIKDAVEGRTLEL
jgi:Cytotoxic